MNPGRDDLAQLAGRLGAKARELAARYPTGAGSAGPGLAACQAFEPAAEDDLAAVRTAQELSALAAAALRLAVDQARSSGRTWQELGDVLGVTRQAAFQRFGHPVDPRTGQPMSDAIIPAAAERATQLLIDWIEGRYGQATADFNEIMAEKMSAGGLA